jgi:hypothetical protein
VKLPVGRVGRIRLIINEKKCIGVKNTEPIHLPWLITVGIS